MRAVFGLVLLVGFGLAGFAIYMVKDHFGAQQALIDKTNARAAAAVPTVEVYAVNRNIEYGEPLTLEDVIVIKYAKEFLPEGTFMSEDDLFPDGADVARVVTHGMTLHEPVLASKVTEPGQNAGITSSLANGKRAFTINVDATTGVSGFLRPGDRVDVYWTGSIASGGLERQGRQITRLIKSSLELIAVDQSSDKTRNSAEVAKTVTVQVSPQDVASLAQAQSTGNLSLSLVGKNDETIATAIEVDQRSLLGIEDAPIIAEAPLPEPERVCTIRQRRGAEVVETPIPCTN